MIGIDTLDKFFPAADGEDIRNKDILKYYMVFGASLCLFEATGKK